MLCLRFAALAALVPVAAFGASSITLQYQTYNSANSTGSVTLNAGQAINLETGAAVSSGGDLAWDGTKMTPMGTTLAADLGSLGYTGATGYSNLTQAFLQLGLSAGLGSANAFSPLQNDVIGAKDNSGNFAKMLVTAIGAGGGGGPATPTITQVANNYSFIPNGFPNSGISPSVVFAIKGTNLGDAPAGALTLNSTAAPGLPTTSANASVSVTVGGKTVTPGLYYASPTQIAGVLPAGTPTGTGTLTVTYKGATSSPFTIQVVPAAPGLGTYGRNQVIATNASTGALFGYTNSAAPSQTIVIWGSGLGADTQDSDTVFASAPHAVNQSATQIYFGSVAGTVLYAGSSGYPGVNQINVTIPSNAPTGCSVSVAGTVNGFVSNFGTLAIATGGGVCSDSAFGLNGTTIGTLGAQSTVRSGTVVVSHSVSPEATTDTAVANFSKFTGSTFGGGGRFTSLGSCFVFQQLLSDVGTGSSTGLNAGTSIGLTGPLGPYILNSLPSFTGLYLAQLPTGAIPSTGGAFTFTGPGGADVGAFTATVNFPNPLLSWTNQSAGATVNRSQGVQVTWNGGSAGSYVFISGATTGSGGAFGFFTCYAPQSAGSFTVPSFVTGTLPAGNGSLSVATGTNFVQFSATGIDQGYGFGLDSIQINSTYQ